MFGAGLSLTRQFLQSPGGSPGTGAPLPAFDQTTLPIDVSKLSNPFLCPDYTLLIKLVLSGDSITAGPRFTFREEITKGNLTYHTGIYY